MTDSLLCHECGKWCNRLVQHVPQVHGMTSQEYRRKHGIPANAPMSGAGMLDYYVQPATAEQEAEEDERFERVWRERGYPAQEREYYHPPERSRIALSCRMLEALGGNGVYSEYLGTVVHPWTASLMPHRNKFVGRTPQNSGGKGGRVRPQAAEAA